MKKIRLGLALTGSFCTFDKSLILAQELVRQEYDVYPIMSEFSYATDTRFGKAADFVTQLELITDNNVIHSIVGAEPIGPGDMLDILVIAPCSGNTLGKLANGITDTCVTYKIH